MLKAACLGIVLAVAPVFSASALCFRGGGFDFASQVNAEFDYLICLHNEQVESINEHADLINDHARSINAQSDLISNQSYYISELERKLKALEYEVDDLKDQIADIKAQPAYQ